MMLSKEELSQTVKLYAYNTKYTATSQMVQIGDKKAARSSRPNDGSDVH